jgi:transposase
MELEHQVLRLVRKGHSRRQIARALKVSRAVVGRIVRGKGAPPPPVLPEPPERTPRASKLDTFAERIRDLLGSYPAITAQRVLEELRGAGYTGGYSILKEHVARLRPVRPPEPSRERPTFGPGEMAEQDWSPYRVQFADGEHMVHAFLLVLSHSRRRYLDFFEAEDLFALLEGHCRAFAYFEGVPARIRYDRQRAVVARCEGPDVFYQPRLLAAATHYVFEPEAVRPRKPNDKAFVERAFWDVERSFLNGRRFRDLDDLRAQARGWLADVVDQRRHPTDRGRRIIDVFAADERPALRPLPGHALDTARVVYRLCSIDGFIAWDGNRYSVPYAHVTALLPVRITQTTLFVYGPDLACVAEHPLGPRGAGRQFVLPGHRPPRPDHPGASLDAIRDRFLGLDESAREFLAGLVETHPRSAAYHARRILELRERYAAPDVARALAHALAFRAFSYTAVTRIVEVRARPRTLDEHVTAQTESRLSGLLADERLQPRDLSTYDQTPTPPEDPPCPSTPPPTKPSKPE